MIIHIALFKWKEGTSPGVIDGLLKNIQSLKASPGIKDILVGENYHKEAKGFTHGVVVLAEDQEALDNYRKHPQHKVIAEKVEEIEEDGIGFDFKNLI